MDIEISPELRGTPADALLREAVAHAVAHESKWDRAMGDRAGIHHLDPAPWNRLLGPTSPRGPATGVVLHGDRTVCTWGEPLRPDMTFSVAKTYLALLAGVAFDRGLLPDPDEPVALRSRAPGFESEHNRPITWAQLLQQTSEWEGSMFGVPDQVDRYRAVAYQPLKPTEPKGGARPLQTPGTYWEYNDVRINQLSLALLHLFGRPLPDVFRDAIMRPCGASDDWQWLGYDNAWVDVAGARMLSVPGGSHWGGGILISSVDQARIGRMLLAGGQGPHGRVLSAQWVARMLQPCPLAPFYGYLLWLNRNRVIYPNASEDSYFALGAGSSITWMSPRQDAVVVTRWIESEHADGFFQRIESALSAIR